MVIRQLNILLACLVCLAAPSLWASQVVARVSSLHHLGTADFPYFQPEAGLLLYVICPAVVVSTFVVYLWPGALITLAFVRVQSVCEWAVLSFGTSLLVLIAGGTTFKLVASASLGPDAIGRLWLGVMMVSALLLAVRTWRGAVPSWLFAKGSERRRLVWLLGVPTLGVTMLTPKVFWENFNVDGIEAFEFGRSLTNHLLPHWEIQDGVFGFYQNFFLFAYPNHWFISLLGPWEAAVRLPFFLYLMPLAAALVLLAEHRQELRLGCREESAIFLGLALYTVVQAFNTNYEPFFADLAETAATDTLWVACFLCACFALWCGRHVWFWVFGLMTYAASPGGLLLLGALAACTWLMAEERCGSPRTVLRLVAVCLVVGVFYTLFYNWVLLGGVNDQFSAYNMLRRLYPPTVTEVVRLNALLFTTGLVPCIALFFVHRSDPETWVMAGITAIYFSIIYIQAWASLHQFTPVMILPLVVFWRKYLGGWNHTRRWLLPTIAVGTSVCLFLSLPRHSRINHAIRDFGYATEYRIGDYDQEYEKALAGDGALAALLPADYRMHYPNQPWGADPHSWLHYTFRPKPVGTAVNYWIQRSDEPALPEAELILDEDGISIYVKDRDVWARHQTPGVPPVVTSFLYEPILAQSYEFFRAYARRVARTSSLSGTSK